MILKSACELERKNWINSFIFFQNCGFFLFLSPVFLLVHIQRIHSDLNLSHFSFLSQENTFLIYYKKWWMSTEKEQSSWGGILIHKNFSDIFASLSDCRASCPHAVPSKKQNKKFPPEVNVIQFKNYFKKSDICYLILAKIPSNIAKPSLWNPFPKRNSFLLWAPVLATKKNLLKQSNKQTNKN